MKSSRFPIFVVGGLLMLLSILAILQYVWLGQISDGERERLRRNLQTDTQRFAEDFNREIQSAYFNFQLNADVWREKNWNDFNERYKFYTEKTAYPNLVKEFYLIELTEKQAVLHYDKETQSFEPAELTPQFANLKSEFSSEKTFQPFVEELHALLMPIYNAGERFDRILVRTAKPNIANQPALEMTKKYGFLIIELDENVIKNQILPDLVKKYFSESESANYNLAILNKENQTVFQTQNVSSTDSSAKLFDLSADNFMFFANREMISSIQGEKQQKVIFSQIQSTTSKTSDENKTEIQFEKNETPTIKIPNLNAANSRVEIQMQTDSKPRVRIFESKTSGEDNNHWTLNVQHNSGSLEQFITNTRYKNLGISFGILSLLGISIVLIFVSSQRAKLLAQRQIDFVSSVSHEFRTPLAVIYSAGENLADGVAKEENQVSRYGDLIKGEGKKLTKMVEQILDFAGAASGKKKYDFRAANVNEIIENALAECQPLIDEKGIKVEKEITENLPEIVADKTALTQAVQNLIVNSIKYSNGENFIKITAQNGNKVLKIKVEDHGIGIAKNDLKHIFEPFFRAKSVVDEQIHGNGLGLSLVKQIVEAHGGQINVASEFGKGSKFTIELSL
jgi:two-component system, OmpR family, sensor histidine kinase SenX3